MRVMLLGFLVLTGMMGAVAAPFWLRQRAQERRWANERNAGSTLKQLACAQADFRGNDRDGNGIEDFWTGDVAGLHALGLTDLDTAKADLRPLVRFCPSPVPKDGYFFIALEADDAAVPPAVYRQTTDPASGPVHNLARFGFMAVPAEPGVSGIPVVMINEGNSLFAYRSGWPGAFRWPSDADRRTRCSRFG
jgi:hypothetical protein